MNITLIQSLLWTVAAALMGGTIWHFRNPPETIEIPSDEPRLYLRHQEATASDSRVDFNQYKAFENLKWVSVKPPPKPVSRRNKIQTPQAPFNLTRVVSSRIVELLSLKKGTKKTYFIGQDITVRDGMKKRTVGKIKKLELKDEAYQLHIEYEGNDFILVLDQEIKPIYDRMGKVKNKRRYINKNPGVLEEHEGRQIAPNSFEVNYEFFNALIDNSADEGNKIKFTQNAEGNFRITQLSEDSALKKFGFSENDILVGFNGKPIKNPKDILANYTDFVSSGQSQAKIRVLRGGKRLNVDFSILNNAGKFKEFYE